MTYRELEAEAWRISLLGDRVAIMNFCAQSRMHQMLMSGELKFSGRPKSKSGVPLFWRNQYRQSKET